MKLSHRERGEEISLKYVNVSSAPVQETQVADFHM